MRHTAIIFFVLIGNLSVAQKKENLIVRKYTQKDGISSYNIRRVTEDKFGFIWIATQDGLSRFDGKTFLSYTKSGGLRHRICGVDIRELIPDSTHDLLWVLPGEVGVNAINTITGNVVKTIPIPSSNNEDWNICMIKDSNYLWIGTFTGIKLFNIATNKFESLPPLSGNFSNTVEFEVRSILKDLNGNIWVCYSGFGIVIYNGHSKEVLKIISLQILNDHLRSLDIRFLKCIEYNPGEILFATNQGLRKINYDLHYRTTIDNSPCKSFTLLNTEGIEYVSQNNKGEVIIAGYNRLFRFDITLSNFTILEEPSRAAESDWLNAVQCIFPDSKNNIWLGCQEGLGFISHSMNPFQSYGFDKITNTKLDHVRSIYPLPSGDILAGLRNGIVFINHLSHEFTKYDTAHLYHHIFQDRDGRIIVSRPDGMFIFLNGSRVPISQIYPEFSDYSTVSINSHVFVGDSLVILGSESNSGILLWYPLQRRVIQIKKGSGRNILSSNIVNNIYRDSKNRLWVLSDNVISILSKDFTKNTQITLTDNKTRLSYKLFFDMCEANGSYWIASYGSGIIQLDTTLNLIRELNSENGLSNDGVYQVYSIADKNLLITSNNGVSLLNLTSFKFTNYFAADGLHSNGFEEVCGLRKNGYIYAGGLNGFTVIDPSKFTLNPPPVLYFTGIRTILKGKSLDTSDLYMKSLTIPNNWLQTNISFVGLNFPRPESVHYEYRIREQDSSWITLGTQNFINLIGLPPGSYTLEAKASNEDGYWSEPIQLALIFLPKWYQTIWFEVFIIFAIGGLLYGFFRFRISQIQKQQDIRRGIASDLHDDIGSLLNSVKVFSHLAKKEPSQDEHFHQIDESLMQATMGLRDMIWVLDNSEDTIHELMDRVKKFAIPITYACGMHFDCTINTSEKNNFVTKTEKRNLLLIIKEVINNSIKYSMCRNIRVECKEVANRISLQITDDGKGFDTTLPATGNGLRNLVDRCRQIQYRCEIISSPGNGTTVSVTKN